MTETENIPPIIPIKYASFNSRMIATAVDMFLIMLVAEPCIEWIMNALFTPFDIGMFSAAITPEITEDPDKVYSQLWAVFPAFWKVVKEHHLIERAVLDNGLQFLFIAAYTIPFWIKYSATPGKILLRLQIQDAGSGLCLTPKQAIFRFMGYVISFVPFTLGFIWIMFNKKKQGFHDMLAKTVVIVKPKKIKSAAR